MDEVKGETKFSAASQNSLDSFKDVENTEIPPSIDE